LTDARHAGTALRSLITSAAREVATDLAGDVVLKDLDDVSLDPTLLHSTVGVRPRLGFVSTFTHGDAVNLGDAWSRVGMADAADERIEHDQFLVVPVVEEIRRHRTSEHMVVLVLTGHDLHAALRRRIREARADFLYHSSELQDTGEVLRTVLRPEQARIMLREDDIELFMRHGVSTDTRVIDAVAYARSNNLADTLTEPGAPPPRHWLAQRREFNRVSRRFPVNGDELSPDREQREPSIVQIGRFLCWATRIRRDDG